MNMNISITTLLDKYTKYVVEVETSGFYKIINHNLTSKHCVAMVMYYINLGVPVNLVYDEGFKKIYEMYIQKFIT